MKIKGYDLDEKLVIELGKFTILWNCFERFQCDNLCTPAKIRSIVSTIQIDKRKQAKLANVLNERRNWFGQLISEYVDTSLHPGNARHSNEADCSLMRAFMEQSGTDLNIGCLLAIYRIRNNLMHGLKIVEQLNDQYDLFCAVNGVLESITEITID